MPLTNDMSIETYKTVVRWGWLVYLGFDNDDIYLSTKEKNVSFNGHSWLGNGILKSVEGLSETKDHISLGASVVLSGYDSSLLNLVLEHLTQSNVVEIWLAMFNSDDTLIADPTLCFKGKFDFADILDDGTNSAITLNYESDLLKINRISPLRYTDQSQQSLYAGDKGFQYVIRASDWRGFWGKVTPPKPTKNRNTTK